MSDRVDLLLESAPHEHALRRHRVELLEARRRRANGLDVGSPVRDEAIATILELAAVQLLARVRAGWDGPLLLHKGPEVSLDYPGARLRSFCDLDLLPDEAAGVRDALLAAGFRKAREVESHGVAHHVCPLEWPGLPLTVDAQPAELGGRRCGTDRRRADRERRSGPAGRRGRRHACARPACAGARRARLVTRGTGSAWEPDRRRRDVPRADEAKVAGLTRRWGCWCLWRTTRTAIGAVLAGTVRSAAVASWARHLIDVRERSVFEWHVKNAAAPVWALPHRRIPTALAAEMWAKATPGGTEPRRAKPRRAELALRNAGTARSEHLLALEARGYRSIQTREAG